ncbi:MAG: hypothetical protein L6Q66_05935, partial [Bacteroidia bacterium]|nr:hypothetical protein [Bacteroidia bacterium]
MSIKHGKYLLGGLPPIVFNFPQLVAISAPQKHKYYEWGRGTGKSTILAWDVKEKPLQMPRGMFFLVGETYSQILTRTLPSTIQGLSMLGIYKDVHYFIGRKAPAKFKWNEPYEPPLNWDHAIHWITGACTHLISLDMPNSGRGLNTCGGAGDEAALFDFEKLFNNVLTTNRAGRKWFEGNPLLNGTTWATSVPMTNKGKWLYKMEQEAMKEPDKILYLRADARHNAHNLGKDWFAENKRVMTDLVYNAEILNIRPDRVEGGFYAQFDEGVHTKDFFNNGYLLSLGYDFDKAKGAGCLADGDRKNDLPLDVSFDWGTNINTVHVEQEYNNESHGLCSMFVKTPNTVDVLVNNLCDYYSGHGRKTAIVWYDHTAIAKGPTGLSYIDVVVKTFKSRGWSVVLKYAGQAPSHHDRYLFWSTMLKGDPKLPRFVLNKTNCKYLIISMQQAGVLQGRNGF